jgi:hypothetical protein
MNTSTAANPLIQLVNQLSQQSAAVHAILQKQIEAMVPGDPDDQEEFGALREIFAESYKKIAALLANQVQAVEDLLEIGVVA